MSRLLWSTLSASGVTFVYERGTEPVSIARRVQARTGAVADAPLPIPPGTSPSFVVSLAELGGGWLAYDFAGPQSGLAVGQPMFGTPIA